MSSHENVLDTETDTLWCDLHPYKINGHKSHCKNACDLNRNALRFLYEPHAISPTAAVCVCVWTQCGGEGAIWCSNGQFK